ncbi:WD40 repeat-like protein, partial [Saccharata proteae CBS 121410]
HECARVPVTALTLAGQYLLAAEGPFLRIFDKEGNRSHGSLQIFKTQAIHGLVVCEQSAAKDLVVLAYGGTFLRLIRLDPGVDEGLENPSSTLGPVTCGPDWILDVAPPFVTDGSLPEGFSTIAVTAHNGLLQIENESPVLDLQKSSIQCLSLSVRELTRSSRCILYSAHLSWLSKDRILVASGTAFGEILVWSCTTTTNCSNTRSHIHHFFTGHEGSIFGVQISPDFFLDGHDSPRRILASCSDDRTIRLWDISDLPDHHDLSGGLDALGLIQDRETGFGANVESDATKSLAVAWGHTSRVWSVRFSAAEPEEGTLPIVPQLVSFGEDATSRLWQIGHSPNVSSSGPGKMSLTLDLNETAAFHSGKNIWSMAIARQPNGKLRVITGGADSAIVSHVWPRDTIEYVSPQPSKDAHRSCAFVSQHEFVSVTNSGQVLLGDFRSGQIDWATIAQLDDLRGYSTTASIPELGLVMFAGNSGKIYTWSQKGSDPQIVAVVDRKVAGLFATLLYTSDSDGITNPRIGLTVTKMGSDLAEFYILAPKGPTLDYDSRFDLKLPPSFVVTSALPVVDNVFPLLTVVVGSREGSIAIFHTQNPPSIQDAAGVIETELVYHVHTPEAVTSLFYVPEPSDSRHLITTGRDGKMATLAFPPTQPLHPVHSLPLPFGPNVEGLFIDRKTRNVMAYGFRGKQFVLYNTNTEQEIMAVECGGSHRIWAFMPSVEGDGGTFVWNQAATLKLFSTTEVSNTVVRGGGHGREIKAVSVRGGDRRLVATGAEDTTIRLFEFSGEKTGDDAKMSGFRCVRVLRKHVTGIQQLAWSACGRFLFSCGGCEEFFVWRVGRVPLVGMGVVCEAVCPTESELPDLRIMSFDFNQKSGVSAGKEAEFIISMVYSDSTLRTYRYTSPSCSSNPSQKPFQLLGTGTYLTSCLTQCASLITPDMLVTASTDGHVAFWPTTATAATNLYTTSSPPISPIETSPQDSSPLTHTYTHRTKIHQSSIKTLSSCRLPEADDIHLVLTGGDDNAIGFSLVRAASPSAPPTVSTLLIPRAHAAAVTASALMPISTREDGEGQSYLAVTASNDQRIKVWLVSVDEKKEGMDGVQVRKLGEGATCVADVSGMDLVGLESGVRGVMVVGVGMEVWGFDGLEGLAGGWSWDGSLR